ncbi:hypothetical protein [Streptomyces hiroshimensis]|uniref:Uncharacterized protein n=1 Tax=Streptomyces hiroshimensis TaxID=66424 RepID=A0ABQ2Z618_9ACTN|nr:hypothetical protein [Streptomyces hiroshimensis]GGY03657.1 hypothetical protein GCM10010324_58220 [Streptomyces hiroshimensis]
MRQGDTPGRDRVPVAHELFGNHRTLILGILATLAGVVGTVGGVSDGTGALGILGFIAIGTLGLGLVVGYVVALSKKPHPASRHR